jgi:hypothetical protein
MLYRDFRKVVIRALFQAPVAYAVARHEEEPADFLSSWIGITKGGAFQDRLYELGSSARTRRRADRAGA